MTAVVAVVLVFSAAPTGFENFWGVNVAGGDLYRQFTPWFPRLPQLSVPVLLWGLRAGFIAAWLAWLLMVIFAHRARISASQSLKWCACVTPLLAVLVPPVLSSDVFGYVAHSRMFYAHGLNPYTDSLNMLDGTGDPAADFKIWRVLLPYGPFWLLITSALGSLGSALGGLLGEVLVHKLLAAAGLLAATVFIGRVAETRHPGFGGTTMLAVGMNPLLLLEGPMTGHNDFIAIGLLAFAAWRCSLLSPKTADFAIGLAIAIKVTAAGVLPLVLASRWKHSNGAGKWTAPVTSLLLAAAPFVVLSLFVGGPGAVLDVVAGRFASMQPTTAVWIGRALLLIAFAWAIRLVLRTADERYVAWITGWVVVSAAIVLTTTTLRFPWYVAWPLVPVFAGWQERDRILMIAISVCGAMLLWRYSVAVG